MIALPAECHDCGESFTGPRAFAAHKGAFGTCRRPADAGLTAVVSLRQGVIWELPEEGGKSD